jgi:hypothetical protein
MGCSIFLKRIIALFLLPLFLFYQFDAPAIIMRTNAASEESNSLHLLTQSNYNFTYDDVLDLMEELEEGDLEMRCSLDQLETFSEFPWFAFCAFFRIL